jgi:hypothetical protein
LLYKQICVILLPSTEVVKMLEFIVLGQIPGTNIVLNFSWIVGIATVAVGLGIVKHEYTQRHTSQQVSIEEMAI